MARIMTLYNQGQVETLYLLSEDEVAALRAVTDHHSGDEKKHYDEGGGPKTHLHHIWRYWQVLIKALEAIDQPAPKIKRKKNQ